MIHFLYPQWFALMALFPLYAGLRFLLRRRGVYVSRIPSTGRTTWRIRTRLIPEFVAAAALILFMMALARPREGFSSTREITRGVALELVIDRSSSMDRPVQGFGRSRFETVKDLFARFAAERPSDLIGIVAFARFAETWCPLTLTRDVMPAYLRILETVTNREEDGTAIGEGILLAAARLKSAEEEYLAAEEKGTDLYTIKSKVIILFTDGNNNTGISPIEAAVQASEWGVRVYAVGFTGRRTDLDTGLLQEIADITGGELFLATSGDAVETIFRTIDTLEKSEVQTEKMTRYRERFQPFILAGMICVLISALLSFFVYRRIL